MGNVLNEEKYFGFWPATKDYFDFDNFVVGVDEFVTNKTKKKLVVKIIEKTGPGWKIAITGDYLCMLQLDVLEEKIRNENNKNAKSEIYELSLGASRYSLFSYCENLNALYFLIYASCFTGRNNYFLHDFAELNVWTCDRFIYSKNGKALRAQHFSRMTEQHLRRLQLVKSKNISNGQVIDHHIFTDAIFYWSIIFHQGLVSSAAVGAKVISEHRLENYKASVALGWFEIEEWLYTHAQIIGVETNYLKGRKKGNKKTSFDLIESFPNGTWVHMNARDIHTTRKLRNDVVHTGYCPSYSESIKSINLFVNIFNFRSGLNLRIDANRTPSFGVS